jgi:hypothetical protein
MLPRCRHCFQATEFSTRHAYPQPHHLPGPCHSLQLAGTEEGGAPGALYRELSSWCDPEQLEASLRVGLRADQVEPKYSKSYCIVDCCNGLLPLLILVLLHASAPPAHTQEAAARRGAPLPPAVWKQLKERKLAAKKRARTQALLS